MTAALTVKDAFKFVEENYKSPPWATGTISKNDAQFLFEMIVRTGARRILEIGVASGVSTAFISRALSALLPDGGHLHSFDAIDYFYANKDKKCGAFVEESFGFVPQNVKFSLGVSSSAIAQKQRGEPLFDFAFVDANHNHPWPCIDMFSVIEVTRPGAWVALHDINLPHLHNGQFPTWGPNYLYNSWPGEKMAASSGTVVEGKGMMPNIGAIRLFDDRAKSIDAVIKCLGTEWQSEVPRQHIEMAAENIALSTPSLVPALRAAVAKQKPELRGGKGTKAPIQYFTLVEKNLCYIKIPKAACTSVIRAMMRAGGCTDPQHLRDTHLHSHRYLSVSNRPPESQEVTTFSFVRHPIARAISFYQDKIVRGDPYIQKDLDELGLTKGISFETMMSKLSEIDPADMEPHIRPQHLTLVQNGSIMTNFLGKIEFSQARWPVLEKAYGLPPLEQANQSVSQDIEMSHSAYQSILTVFADDFRTFRYVPFPPYEAATRFGFRIS